MKKFLFYIFSISFLPIQSFAQKNNGDSLQVRTIEDVKLHKTGNPNKAKYFSLKSNITPLENPQATTVVTHEMIEQQQAQQLSDVVKNVSGVYLTSSRGSSQESFGARGYAFSTDNIFKNGSRVNSGVFPEVSGLERVEVLKGSAAILYGNVAPGGVVNMITKKPLFQTGGNLSMNFGSWNNYKPSLDIYGALTKNAAFRMNGSYEYKESFRDVVQSQKHYFNPSILINLSNKTQLIIEADYLKHHFTPDFGLGGIMDGKTSVSTIETGLQRNQFVGADWQYQINQMATSTITLNHQISEKWLMNFVTNYQNYTRDYYSTERIQWLVNTTNKVKNPERSWERPLNKIYTEQNYASTQLNIMGEFNTGKFSHKITFGADADYSKTDTYAFDQPKFYGTNGNTKTPTATEPNFVLLDQPETWASGNIPNANKVSATLVPMYRYGFFVQNLASFGKWKLLTGLRYSYLDYLNTQLKNFKNNTQTTNQDATQHQAFSPKIGLVYMPTEQFSVFASYANSFVPNSGLGIDKKPLQPSIINQYEIGLKKNVWKNTLAMNLTLYQIDNSNMSQPHPLDVQYRELTGKTRSRGVELDIVGNPTPNLSISAGYSYNHMVFVDTPESAGSYVEGEKMVRTPANTANISAYYSFSKWAKGLKIGGQIFHTGTRLSGWNNTKGQTQVNRLLELEPFTTVDFSVGYSFKKMMIQGKVGNVFDVVNYTVHDNYSVNPITPRNFYLTFTYKL